jgi:hypothetical protein
MSIIYTDQEISQLLHERKVLPAEWPTQVRFRDKRGHKEFDLDVSGESGNEFRVILRRNSRNLFNFSVILAVHIPLSTQLFRLRRYNGKSHRHTNPIEGVTFYDYHIHMATERYQGIGSDEDTYAEMTTMYSNYSEAFELMLREGNFVGPPTDQMGLFC